MLTLVSILPAAVSDLILSPLMFYLPACVFVLYGPAYFSAACFGVSIVSFILIGKLFVIGVFMFSFVLTSTSGTCWFLEMSLTTWNYFGSILVVLSWVALFRWAARFKIKLLPLSCPVSAFVRTMVCWALARAEFMLLIVPLSVLESMFWSIVSFTFLAWLRAAWSLARAVPYTC